MQNKSTQEFDDIIRNIIENQKVKEKCRRSDVDGNADSKNSSYESYRNP